MTTTPTLIRDLFLHPRPIGLVHPSRIGIGRADWIGAGHLDPSLLSDRDGPDLIGDLGKILILAEEDSHVICVFTGEPYNVKRQPDIDALFLAYQNGRARAVG